MIIKSLSRQTKSFGALYKYLTRDKDSILRGFNLYSNPYSKKETVKEFLQNADYLKRSRGKNYYYHEIISLVKNNLSKMEQEKILSDLASKYISLRAENHLTFTALHTDKKHTHIHLMISANEYMGTKRVRLSKKDFNTIQKEIEQYANTIYPELGKTKHYNKNFEYFKNKKEELLYKLDEIFKKSSSKDLFEKMCTNHEIEFYTRGKNTGVIFYDKKYRLKTLGKLDEYEKLTEHFTKQKEKEKTAPLNENEAKINTSKENKRSSHEQTIKRSKNTREQTARER